ncbi:leucine-rich repeat protein [Candidatus Stoquefichus massiliensis]|uniref:leucine-rich repeat protein n=1 Tax=Candidatus Stoquefichus massiliensis TaxID=1470350 RepID=UPI0004802352|nr:leucine-rich repeat protein [Candidatus Stoquefichus massiliensis]
MLRKYHLEEKYQKKLSHVLQLQMKIIIVIGLLIMGMNVIANDTYAAESEVYGLYKKGAYSDKVYECNADGSEISNANEIDVKDVTYLYIAADVRIVKNIKKSPVDEPKVHTVKFLGTAVTELNRSFSDFVNLTKIVGLENTPLQTIGSSTFANTRLIDITLPSTVKNVDSMAFNHCLALTNISVKSEGTPAFYSQDGVLYKKETSTNAETLYKYPDGKTEESYIVPDNVKVIGEWAFENSISLKSITIAATVETIARSAFFSSSIETVQFKDLSQLKTIGEFAFDSSHLQSITLPKQLETIERCAFRSTQLTAIDIPQKVNTIDSSAFNECIQLASINVASGNTSYQSIEGVLYTQDGKTLCNYPIARETDTYIIKDGVETIEKYAFDMTQKTPYVTIPASVKNINEFAFYSSKIERMLLLGNVSTFGEMCFERTNLTLYTLNANDVGNVTVGERETHELQLYIPPVLELAKTSQGKAKDILQLPKVNNDTTFKDELQYSYASSDSAVASVDANGLVTMHKAGTATLTASVKDCFNEVKAETVLTVTENTNNSVDDPINSDNTNNSTDNPNNSENTNNPIGNPNPDINTGTNPPKEMLKDEQKNNQTVSGDKAKVETSDTSAMIFIEIMIIISGLGIMIFRRKENS